MLALEGEAYTALGTFSGEQPLRSRVLPQGAILAQRLFPRQG